MSKKSNCSTKEKRTEGRFIKFLGVLVRVFEAILPVALLVICIGAIFILLLHQSTDGMGNIIDFIIAVSSLLIFGLSLFNKLPRKFKENIGILIFVVIYILFTAALVISLKITNTSIARYISLGCLVASTISEITGYYLEKYKKVEKKENADKMGEKKEY